ncbi:MAG: hypothetical protein GY893_13020 [bacterium]|nr:hypothetical protein [bacterium]
MVDKNNNSVAVFLHDNTKTTLVKGYDPPGSYRRVFNYSTPLESMIAVINQSTKCKQFTKAECFAATLTTSDSVYTWLSGRYGQKLAYWGGGPSDGKGCSCGIHNNCAHPDKKCNCDSNDQVWRKDKGFITEKDVLPITAINVGDTGRSKERFKYTVTSLICFF